MRVAYHNPEPLDKEDGAVSVCASVGGDGDNGLACGPVYLSRTRKRPR